MYTLLNNSLQTLHTAISSVEGMEGIRRICSVVTLGVLNRDYDFQKHAPEEASGVIQANNHTQTLALLHSELEKELAQRRSGALNRNYFCQLIICYLRIHLRAIDQISPSFLRVLASVVSSREFHS